MIVPYEIRPAVAQVKPMFRGLDRILLGPYPSRPGTGTRRTKRMRSARRRWRRNKAVYEIAAKALSQAMAKHAMLQGLGAILGMTGCGLDPDESYKGASRIFESQVASGDTGSQRGGP